MNDSLKYLLSGLLGLSLILIVGCCPTEQDSDDDDDDSSHILDWLAWLHKSTDPDVDVLYCDDVSRSIVNTDYPCAYAAATAYPDDHEAAMEYFIRCQNSSDDPSTGNNPYDPLQSFNCNLIPSFNCSFTVGDSSFCQQLLVDGSFDNLIYIPGDETLPIPNTEFHWEGDKALIVDEGDQAARSQGIRACDGNKMLRFLGTKANGPGQLEDQCSAYQIVDIRSYAESVNTGEVYALGRVLVDRVQFDQETDSRFGLSLYAIDGTLEMIPAQISNMTTRNSLSKWLETDNVRGWEEITIEMFIPPGTDYLAFEISAVENNRNDGDETEFDGHFADAAILQLSRNCIGTNVFEMLETEFNDADWDAKTNHFGNTVSESFVSQQDGGVGNPAPSKWTEQSFESDGSSVQAVIVSHWYTTPFDPGPLGIESVSFRFDVSTPGVAVGPVIKQGDNYYQVWLPAENRIINTLDGEWKTFNGGACLKPSDFFRREGTGPSAPDFNQPMNFGYFTANSAPPSGMPGMGTQYVFVDNFEVTAMARTINVP